MTTSDILTVTQAAKRAGVSPSTIRRWIDSGALVHTSNKEGWRLVTKDHLMTYLAREGPETSRTLKGASAREVPIPSMLPSHETALKIALEALEHERRVNADLRTQVKELERERTQHMAEMRALLTGKNEGLLSVRKWFGKTS